MEFASGRTSLLLLGATLVLTASLAASGCRRRDPARAQPQGQTQAPSGPATAPLRGRVLDTAGRPVPEARVLARPNLDAGATPPREARSDGDGVFLFDRLPAGAYTLVVEAAGLLPSTPPAVAVPGPEAVVRLAETGRALSGTVAAAGVPVAGARVRLGGEGVVPARTTTSDATGAFVFHGLGAGRYALRATSGPLASATIEGLADGGGKADGGAAAPVRLALVPGVIVAGTVVDDRGLPLPAVEVSATPTAPEENDALPEVVATGADGGFRVGPLPPGTLRLGARAPGYLLRDPATVALVAGQAPPATRLELVRGAAISGRVVDARGAAQAGADVRCVGAGADDLVVLYEPLPLAAEAAALGGAGRAVGGAKAVRTDARGTFTLEGLLPGRVHLEIARKPLVPLRTGDWTLAPGQHLDAGVLTLRDGVLLSGRVVDEAGMPLAGARVTTTPTAGLFAETDAAGTFQLALTPGAYEVTATGRAGGAASTKVRVDAAAPPPAVTLTLSRADAALEGVVVDSGRRPLVRARVRAFAADAAGAAPEGPPLGAASTDAGGHFTLSRLPRRRLLIEVDHASYPRTLASATPGALAELVVPIPGGVDGEVRERASGATVPRARIDAKGPGGEKLEATANDKRAGAFRLARVRPGRWSLTASAPGYTPTTRELDVPASEILGDASVRGLRLELDAAAPR